MTMEDIVNQICFELGVPASELIEGLDPKQAVLIAFRDLKAYMKTPVDKTVPYATRIALEKNEIFTKDVLYCQTAKPRIGLTMSSIDSGNVFQIAAAANVYSQIGNTASLNIDPIMTEMAMAQVRNTLGTDFQWTYDRDNDCVYCAHRDPRPVYVTIRYVPDYKDVSEIQSPMWINYLVRLSEAYFKRALGRTRSKYTITGSNVELDGDVLLNEAKDELDSIHEELGAKRQRITVLN